jgi:hypothetical protein
VPEKTITVTETSSKVFENAAGTITAEANMENAFSDSVEVRVTDTRENPASFGLSAGDEVYPFDISLYIKGTDQKTKPAPGYAVTISLPVPEKLLDVKARLTIMHKSDSGVVTEIPSRLVQKNGVWYLVFEATEFSPYALVIRNAGSYSVMDGVPYYLDERGSRVFIGFASNGKYIAPEGVTVLAARNEKSFTDIAGHWAAGYIGFCDRARAVPRYRRRRLLSRRRHDTRHVRNGHRQAVRAQLRRNSPVSQPRFHRLRRFRLLCQIRRLGGKERHHQRIRKRPVRPRRPDHP